MVVDLKTRAITSLKHNTLIFPFIWKMKEHELFARRVLRPTDAMLIEGYPRSANSFAYYAFLLSQPCDLKIGNHCHTPSQFSLARKYQTPSLLVLRDPIDAALSYMIYEPKLSASKALWLYIQFHKPMIRNTKGYVVGEFHEVISDFGLVIRRVNKFFDCDFSCFGHTDRDVTKVYNYINRTKEDRSKKLGSLANDSLRSTTPTNEKNVHKVQRLHELQSSNLLPLLNEANDLYKALLGHPSRSSV